MIKECVNIYIYITCYNYFTVGIMCIKHSGIIPEISLKRTWHGIWIRAKQKFARDTHIGTMSTTPWAMGLIWFSPPNSHHTARVGFETSKPSPQHLAKSVGSQIVCI